MEYAIYTGNGPVPVITGKGPWVLHATGSFRMGEIIDFKSRETKRRNERIQALLYKALTGLLNPADEAELRRLTEQSKERSGTPGNTLH